MKKLILLFLLTISLSYPQINSQDSIWVPFSSLIGEWEGTGDGQPGKGDYCRSYRFIFNNKFIEIKNKSTYPPSEKNPEGEVHEDIGYLSYDKNRNTFVLRQFHKEGFVNQYKLESISNYGKTLVFMTESIENIPEGWRAKETYRLDDGEFTEIFELASPGNEFEVYTKAKFYKK